MIGPALQLLRFIVEHPWQVAFYIIAAYCIGVVIWAFSKREPEPPDTPEPPIDTEQGPPSTILNFAPIGAGNSIPGSDWFYHAIQVSNGYSKRAIPADNLTARLSFQGFQNAFEVERALFVKRDTQLAHGMWFPSKISLQQNDYAELVVLVSNSAHDVFKTMRSFPVVPDQEDTFSFEEWACYLVVSGDGGIRAERDFKISIQRKRHLQITAA